MPSPSKFHVREVDSAAGDGEFIIAAFDSALPYLASIGSHEQWGLTPFSERDGWVAETVQQVHDAETYRLTGKGDALRIFIVEAEVPGQDDDKDACPDIGVRKLAAEGRHELHSRIKPGQSRDVLPIGFAFIRENAVPQYILTQEHITIEGADKASCLYIEVMVADHRIDTALRKGSGAALIQGIRDFGRESQKRCLFIDAWAGNSKKLIGYYEQQDFEVKEDFRLSRNDKVPWVGTLMRMEILPP